MFLAVRLIHPTATARKCWKTFQKTFWVWRSTRWREKWVETPGLCGD